MSYAIAYNDNSGSGFSALEPFVHDDIRSLEDAICQREKLIIDGYRNVTIFSFKADELPEFISWNFVLSHKLA